MIKPLPGTQAKWQNGSVSSYWNLPQHPWQPFQLSNKDGGEAIIVWKPTPYYTSTGQ
jgi:hypothetical protein